VTVIAVGGDDVVVWTHEGARADGDAFLADVKVEEASHLSCLVVFESGLFESSDPNHFF